MTTTLPVAFYLRELSGEPVRRGERESASDIEMRIGEAHARGVLEGRAAAQVENDAVLADHIAAAKKKLTDERAKWSEEEGGKLADLFVQSINEIERHISEQVSRVLTPILSAQIRERAVESIAQTLAGLLSNGDLMKVAVRGPIDLVAHVESKLGARASGISFDVAEAVDLTVTADDTILETRIGEWGRAIVDNDVSMRSVPISVAEGEGA